MSSYDDAYDDLRHEIQAARDLIVGPAVEVLREGFEFALTPDEQVRLQALALAGAIAEPLTLPEDVDWLPLAHAAAVCADLALAQVDAGPVDLER